MTELLFHKLQRLKEEAAYLKGNKGLTDVETFISFVEAAKN